MTGQRAFTRLSRQASSLAAIAASAVIATACGSSNSPSSGSGGGTSSAGVAQARAVVARLSKPTTTYTPPGPPIDTRSLRGKNVWYIPLSLTVPVWAISNGTIQTALSKVGITEHSCSGDANPSTISACINEAVSRGANAIVTDGIPVALAANAFANAESHHIPLVIADQLPPKRGQPGYVTGMGNDKIVYSPQQAAALVSGEADWTIADSNGKANVLMEPYTDSPSTLSYAATTEAVFKHLCPACTVTTQDIGVADPSAVPSQTSSALLRDPNAQYLLPEYDALLTGDLAGVQQAGLTGKIKIVTSAGDLPALQAIKSGRISVDLGESFPYEGWDNADEAMRMMLGKPVVTEKPPLRMFTKANINSLALTPAAQASGAWYGSQSYMTMFEHLWGVH